MISEQQSNALAATPASSLTSGRLTLSGLLACEAFFFAAVLVSTSGVLFWVAAAMILPTLAFTWQGLARQRSSSGLAQLFTRINSSQIDLRLNPQQLEQDDASQTFAQLNNRLRSVIIELQRQRAWPQPPSPRPIAGYCQSRRRGTPRSSNNCPN